MTASNALGHSGGTGIGAVYNDSNININIGTATTYNSGGGPFTGSIDEVRVYAGKCLSDEEVQGLYLFPAGTAPGSTIIEGGRIQTGKIQSTNYGSSVGSELDLNAGTIKLGGHEDALFEVTNTGVVTASAGVIGGVTMSVDALSIGTSWAISSSLATNATSFISSSGLKVSSTSFADSYLSYGGVGSGHYSPFIMKVTALPSATADFAVYD